MGNHVPFRFASRSALLVGAVLVMLLIGRGSAQASGGGRPIQAPQSKQAYCEVYVKALASALKVSVAQLAAANKSALEATIQQAYSDGAISQAQQTKQMNFVKQMGEDPCADFARAASAQHSQMAGAHQAIMTATASALKLTPSALQQDLASGMTIPQIASAQHVNLSDVNTAYLNAVQTQLKSAVADGTITQAQADKMYTSVEQAVAAGRYPLLRAHNWSGQK